MSTQDALEGLLDLCDQIRDLHERALRAWPGDGSSATQRAALARDRVRGLRDQVFSALPALRARPLAQQLSDAELLLLAMFFHRRVTGLHGALTGGDAVAILSQAGFPRATLLQMLEPSAPLRRQGWLAAELIGEGFDPLDARLIASREALRLFWPAVPVELPPVEERTSAEPFRDEAEFLWELYRWRNLCLQRAEAVFEPDGAFGTTGAPELPGAAEAARDEHLSLRARLKATAGGSAFRIEEFRREHKLGSDDLLVLVHLLFCEMLEGESFVSGVECLRILAGHRDEMFTKRAVVGPRGRLRKHGIVVVPEDNQHPAKGHLCEMALADWASEQILAGVGRGVRLGRDELDKFFEGNDGETPL